MPPNTHCNCEKLAHESTGAERKKEGKNLLVRVPGHRAVRICLVILVSIFIIVLAGALRVVSGVPVNVDSHLVVVRQRNKKKRKKKTNLEKKNSLVRVNVDLYLLVVKQRKQKNL